MKTWTDSNQHLWLRDSLPGHIPNARIMTYGYDSSVFFPKSQMSVQDFVRDLFERLGHLRQRDPHETTRPLIFICHSLGGVVFKSLLVHLSANKNNPSAKAMADSISGVVFLGTPHRGSRLASPASILARIVNVATVGFGVRSSFLKLLQVSSSELESISLNATYLLADLDVISFYEQKALGPSLVSLAHLT
ncbi:ankyrin repeat protein [Colletotrichum truncatum]|uniref:Ankyrin repeat protein n=1 Tax=Colletotrichum truncatum TaxID=5467 RepID=A0ACC3YV33_COLTU